MRGVRGVKTSRSPMARTAGASLRSSRSTAACRGSDWAMVSSSLAFAMNAAMVPLRTVTPSTVVELSLSDRTSSGRIALCPVNVGCPSGTTSDCYSTLTRIRLCLVQRTGNSGASTAASPW